VATFTKELEVINKIVEPGSVCEIYKVQIYLTVEYVDINKFIYNTCSTAETPDMPPPIIAKSKFPSIFNILLKEGIFINRFKTGVLLFTK
jgi:hypothetical protein